MNYEAVFSLDAVEDVLRITMASQSKAVVLKASKQTKDVLTDDPADAEHLSEGSYFIDREPLGVFYTIDTSNMTVEVVNVKTV